MIDKKTQFIALGKFMNWNGYEFYKNCMKKASECYNGKSFVVGNCK